MPVTLAGLLRRWNPDSRRFSGEADGAPAVVALGEASRGIGSGEGRQRGGERSADARHERVGLLVGRVRLRDDDVGDAGGLELPGGATLRGGQLSGVVDVAVEDRGGAFGGDDAEGGV